MERTVVTEFNSLDGVIQAPGGGEDFQRGGRTVPFDQSEDGAKFKLEETLQAEAVLLGRPSGPTWTKLDGAGRRGSGGGRQAPAASGRGHRGPQQRPTGADAARVRPGRRAAPDDLPEGGWAGKRLFGDTSGTKRLRLADTRTVGDRPAGQDATAANPGQGSLTSCRGNSIDELPAGVAELPDGLRRIVGPVPHFGDAPLGSNDKKGIDMAVSRTHRYTVDPADLEELIARRARLIAAVRAAHPGLTQTRLTRLEDGTCTDVWSWDSTEQMQAALADMPRFGAQAGAAWSLTRDATHLGGDIVDER
jgi:hypothetical protein